MFNGRLRRLNRSIEKILEEEVFVMISTVVLAHFFALLSPGPDFLLVVKSGIRNKKNNAIGIALGIASANAVYILLCIIGVGEILSRSFILMKVLRISGGLFLTYIAFMALKAKKSNYSFINKPIDNNKKRISFLREYLTGFISGITNPKNLIFYLSLFSLVLTESINLSIKIALGTWMAFLVFMWDAFIIFILSKDTIKKMFSKIAFYVDKVAGTILGFIGLKLIKTSVFEDY